MKSYTIEQLEYLRKIHLGTYDTEFNEYWTRECDLYDQYTEEFITWLSLIEKENRIIELLDDYLHSKT